MTAQLTIVLGPGGVGKTTLASGLALAHARVGARAALLGVDPARRLRSALGLAELPEHGVRLPVAGAGRLDAALLDSGATLRRWVGEACPDDRVRARVLADPFFRAIADRLAELSDAVGCARAAEWAERDPDLDELVLDTAPGTAGIDVLARPDQVLAFAGGRMMRWLVRLARIGAGGRLVRQLGDLTGGSTLRGVGELLAALDTMLATLTSRLERARRWLADANTSIVVVSTVREDACASVRALAAALGRLSLAPSLVVLDRVLPASLAHWTPGVCEVPEAHAFVRAVANRMRAQERVRAELARDHGRVLAIPEAIGLDGSERLSTLATLAEPLRVALSSRRAVRAA